MLFIPFPRTDNELLLRACPKCLSVSTPKFKTLLLTKNGIKICLQICLLILTNLKTAFKLSKIFLNTCQFLKSLEQEKELLSELGRRLLFCKMTLKDTFQKFLNKLLIQRLMVFLLSVVAAEGSANSEAACQRVHSSLPSPPWPSTTDHQVREMLLLLAL